MISSTSFLDIKGLTLSLSKGILIVKDSSSIGARV